MAARVGSLKIVVADVDVVPLGRLNTPLAPRQKNTSVLSL